MAMFNSYVCLPEGNLITYMDLSQNKVPSGELT